MAWHPQGVPLHFPFKSRRSDYSLNDQLKVHVRSISPVVCINSVQLEVVRERGPLLVWHSVPGNIEESMRPLEVDIGDVGIKVHFNVLLSGLAYVACISPPPAVRTPHEPSELRPSTSGDGVLVGSAKADDLVESAFADDLGDTITTAAAKIDNARATPHTRVIFLIIIFYLPSDLMFRPIWSRTPCRPGSQTLQRNMVSTASLCAHKELVYRPIPSAYDYILVRGSYGLVMKLVTN